jgi:hypothetical protein
VPAIRQFLFASLLLAAQIRRVASPTRLIETAGDPQGLKVSLDEWDLLHQRRALREAHLDQEAAALRPADLVERYEK